MNVIKNAIKSFIENYSKKPPLSLGSCWGVKDVNEEGYLFKEKHIGFMFELEGLDASFFPQEEMNNLHRSWRSALHLSPGEEMQIIYKKRVEFAEWIEEQLRQSFLANSTYGRKILLDRLADQVSQMSQDQPRLLNQKIVACFWTNEILQENALEDKRSLILSQLESFGFNVRSLNKKEIEKEINVSAQDSTSSELQEPEWPSLKVEAGSLEINNDCFRALELVDLPENYTELGMIQAITSLPYPLDICVRFKARDNKPIISRFEKKRNLLQAKKGSNNSSDIDSQLEQIDDVLRSLADRSEQIFDMRLTIGLRLPKDLAYFQRQAMATIMQEAAKMDFCVLEESTINTFDSYLECIPSFSGQNIKPHTVLGSNAIHFLPFFRPSKGDKRAIVSFQTKSASLYSIDPVDPKLANYNWLVSGTSGAGKSFFVNSLIAQSGSIDPNVFVVDIGGSYNKLIKFLGGRVKSLEPGQGFEISPFFLSKSDNPVEERMRKQHIYQIFLEMTRVDDKLPSIEVRHLLSEKLEDLLEKSELPEHPIQFLVDRISKVQSKEAKRLKMLLEPWTKENFYGQFLDNNKEPATDDNFITFDLKGLTEFPDLSRVVQLIVCASLWAKIRQTGTKQFSWIVLDEVAFSLLKTQAQFVDELVSTLRKYFAGAVIVVQDLEKVTSNLAGSSILQNTQTKAILQQRGNPKNYSDILSLNEVDQRAIESLRRKKGEYSDIFLIRDDEKTVIRHVPSELEYWLATTAPEDKQTLSKWMEHTGQSSQQDIIDFSSRKKGRISK